MLEQIKKGLDKTLSFVCVLFLGIMVICVSWQVLSRYVVHVPSTWTDEIARFLMIWTCLLGSAYAVGAQRHIAIDIVPILLGPKKRAILDVFINLCILVFSLVVITGGGWYLLAKVFRSGQLTIALNIPYWIVYIVIPVSGLLMAFYSLYHLLNPKPPEPVDPLADPAVSSVLD
ncbi:TRAP transporter small permease [Martelella radicis]|uniref:TRAP transporter small permease protein n=1 Tax=Martelella radicis TaxID=1397476 RepID=A0A7W6KLY7_9HYPH|nr:TRAP transporter small permease [Martelella radicis]MBB4123749.1 TRAP-type C4-dicarboxylate transport system permease small subunit [Martelella radicis]